MAEPGSSCCGNPGRDKTPPSAACDDLSGDRIRDSAYQTSLGYFSVYLSGLNNDLHRDRPHLHPEKNSAAAAAVEEEMMEAEEMMVERLGEAEVQTGVVNYCVRNGFGALSSSFERQKKRRSIPSRKWGRHLPFQALRQHPPKCVGASHWSESFRGLRGVRDCALE